MSAEDRLRPAPRDVWGRFYMERGLMLRDLWVRPRDLMEVHAGVEHLEPAWALDELEGWVADARGRDFLARVHEQAFGPPFAQSAAERWATIVADLGSAFESGWLVIHTERLEEGAPGHEPVLPRPPKRVPTPLPRASWIEIVMVDDSHAPMVEEPVRVVDAGGTAHERNTNAQGFLRLESVAPGLCDVSFPRIDGREWALGRVPGPGGSPDASPRTVLRGEHASLIARRAGFRVLATLWEHQANAELRAERDPDLLVPGDAVAIPVRDERVEECATTQRHTFVVRSESLRLRLRFQQPRGLPWAMGACEMVLGSRTSSVPRDREGAISMDVPLDVQHVEARRVLDVGLALWVGDLHPGTTDVGARQRLLCLGYCASIEDQGRDLQSAVEEFQCDEQLAITGELDDATRAKLREVHGC